MRAVFVFILSLLATTSSAQTISFVGPPAAVGSGLQTGEFIVRLSDNQHGGVFVSLAVADSNLALVAEDDESVGAAMVANFVVNGATDARFVVQGLEGLTGTVTVTASAPGFADAVFDVDVVTPGFRINGLSGSLDVPDPDDAFYVQLGRLNAAGTVFAAAERLRVGGPGTTATFTVIDAVVGELVTTALTGQTVDLGLVGGLSSSPNSVAAGGVAFSPLAEGATEVTASIPGFTGLNGGTVAVTVGPALLSYTGMPATVGSGLRTTGLQVRINGSAHGGMMIHLVSNDSTKVLLAAADDAVGQGTLDLFLADGASSVSFWAHGLEGIQGISPVDASASGLATISEGVVVVPPAVDLQGLSGSIDTLDPVDSFYARVGVANTTISGLAYTQAVRPGSAGLEVMVTCDDPAVGLLATDAATGDTVLVRIEAGQAGSPTSVASGGVAFDGVGEGTATVSAAIPGFTPTGNAMRQVTVSQPALNLLGIPNFLGAGLQAGGSLVQLGASAHGGTTVHVALAEPLLALVSGAADTVGAASVDLFVPDGQTIAYFHLQGLEDAAGLVHLAATAPGFTARSDSVEVVAPRIQITPGSLASTRDTIDPPDPFYARVGIPFGTGSMTAQALRAGSAGVDVTAGVDDPLLARMVTSTDTLPSVSIRLEAGQSVTGTSLAAGGVAFDALAPGVAVVTVSAPGFVPLATASHSVTISAAAFSLFSGSDVGSGLTSSLHTIQLSGSAHGGTTVHVAVSDSTLALLAPNGSTPGQPSLDLFVPDGQQNTQFVFQGRDGVAGAVTATISAPGFAASQIERMVLAPAVDIIQLGSSLDVTDPDDNFRLRVGLPNTNNSAVGAPQARRFGAPPLVATVSCADAAVANVVTLGGSAGSGQVEIAGGQTFSPSSVAVGGMALRGVGPGTTLVTASIPGFQPMGNATVEVDVTQNGVALLGVPAALGAGLQTLPLVARLSDGAHGGVTMRIFSDDPGALIVSPDAATAGVDTLEVTLNNGQVDAVFHLQALPGAGGGATVSATVAGFDPGSRSLQLVTPALALTQLPDSLDVAAPDAPFVIQVGVPAADLSGLARTQAVRAGAAPLVVPVILGDGSRADLVTDAVSADSVGVAIAPGQFQSAGTVAGGGVALAGVQAGPVVVSAGAEGYTPVATSSALVIVFGDLSAVGDTPRVFALHGNFPNPFNPATVVSFSLAREGRVRLEIFDLRGRRVRRLVDGPLGAGSHEVRWDGTDERGRRQESGVYLMRLRTADGTRAGKMTLVK